MGVILDLFYDFKMNFVLKFEEYRNCFVGVVWVLRFGCNLLFCLFLFWVCVVVGVMCVWIEIIFIDFVMGVVSGGVVVMLWGSGIFGARDVGCFFGIEAEYVFVCVILFIKLYVVCVVLFVVDLFKLFECNVVGYVVLVCVGMSVLGAATEFGELFVYTIN